MRKLERRVTRLLKLIGMLILLAALAGIVDYAYGPSTAHHDPTLPTAFPTVAEGSGGVIGAFVEPDDGRKPITDELDAAHSTIDVMIYLLTDKPIIQELVAAEQRGVAVRVIMEKDPYGGYGNPEETAQTLRDGGVAVKWSSSKFTFTHAKTIVVDHTEALLLTLNLTKSAFDANREFGIVTTRPADVASAQAIFDADWSGKAIANPGDLVVSPLNSRAQIEALIGSATKTIDIYAEVVSDKDVASLLEKRARAGIDIRLIMPPDSDPAAIALLNELTKAGVTVHLLNSPYIHAKAIVVDGTRAFVGSENFTATSLDDNREIGITLDDRASVARVTGAFDHDFAKPAAKEEEAGATEPPLD